MPKLPFYDRTVKGDALNPAMVRAPGPSGLDALGAGIAKVGAATAGIASDVMDERAKAAEKARRDAQDAMLNQFETNAFTSETVYLDDNEIGLGTKKGFDALPAGDVAKKNMARDLEDLYKAIPDEEARAEAQRRGARHLAQFDRRVEGYVSGQLDVGKRSALKGRVDASLRKIAANPTDPIAIRDEIFDSRTAIEEAANSFEEGKANADAHETDIHKTVLSAYLAADDEDGAEKYLSDPHVAEIMGDAGKKFAAVIADSRAHKGAFAVVDAAMREARAGDPDEGWPDEAAARRKYEETRSAITNPKKRDLADAAFEEALARADKQRKARISDVYDEAFTAYNERGLKGIPRSHSEWLNERAPKLWEWFKSDALSRWRSAQANQPKIPDTPAQAEALLQLKLDLYRDPKGTSSIDAKSFRVRAIEAGVSPAGLEEASDYLVQKQKMDGPDKGISAAQFKAQADAGQAAFGIPSTGKAGEKARNIYDGEMAIYYATLKPGETPSPKDLQDAIDRAGIKALGEKKAGAAIGARRGGDAGAAVAAPPPEPPLAPASPKAPVRMTVPGIDLSAHAVPAADRAQIEAALRRAGRPVTESAIAAAYAKRGTR